MFVFNCPVYIAEDTAEYERSFALLKTYGAFLRPQEETKKEKDVVN